MTVQANALAVFLRGMTEGHTVRELAKSYGAGKTSWSDYRSGAKIVPLDLLKRVVLGRVRDERGRAELWARARDLHAAACAAEKGRARSGDGRPVAPETWEMLQRAQRQADAELARSEEALRALVRLSARLQKELDDAIARAEHGPVTSAGPAADAPPQEDGSSPDRGARVPGTAVVLWAPRPPALCELQEDMARVGAEVEVRRQRVSRLREEVRDLRQPYPAPAGGVLVRRESPLPADRRSRRPPVLPSRSRTLRGSRGRRRLCRILLFTAVVMAVAVPATSMDPLRQWSAPSVAEPATALRPESGPQTPPAGSPPPAAPPASGNTEPPGTPSPARSAAAPPAQPSSSPSPGVLGPRLPDEEPNVPGGPADVPAPTGSGVYAIAEDGAAVIQWSGAGTAWVRIGGPAAKLYVGPAGVFATDPQTGDLRGYSGVPGRWRTVSGRAADFATSGPNLYRLAQDRSAVQRWDRAHGTWTRVGGPAGRLYGGGAGLFATDPVDGRIFAYGGEGEAWSFAGTAGADFVVTDQHLYGLNPERNAVFRWSGEAGVWSPVGGPAGALYASSSELYAVNEADDGLWRYRAGTWSRVADAGAAVGVRGERLYLLDKDRSAVWERDGAARLRIGGPVRALVVAD
ncbi:hypothetical protein ACWFQ8_18515 [Streptomyces sp. NPDC055254]